MATCLQKVISNKLSPPLTGSSSSSPSCNFTSLPNELFLEILKLLPERSLLSLSRTNRLFRSHCVPLIYHTISISCPGTCVSASGIPRTEHAESTRINQLLRSLLNNPDLPLLVNIFDLRKWNITTPAAVRGSDRLLVFDISRGEVKALKDVVWRIILRLRMIGGGNTAWSEMKSDVEEWVHKIVSKGDLDASFAVLMVLVSEANLLLQKKIDQYCGNKGLPSTATPTKGLGLTELHLELDHVDSRSQPQYLWKVFLLFWPSGTVRNLESTPKHKVPCTCGLPFLKNITIIASRYREINKLELYDCHLPSIVVPLLCNPQSNLTHIQLTLLDNAPFSWPQDNFHPPRANNLTSLTLKNAHVSSLGAILNSTPKLKHLNYTLLLNQHIDSHSRTTYIDLGNALQPVKNSLKSLKLNMFAFGNDLPQFTLLGICCVHGDPRDLRLRDFQSLKEFTGGLALLVGEKMSSRISFAEALPGGLEVLGLVDENHGIFGAMLDWENQVVGRMVEEYLNERVADPWKAIERSHCLNSTNIINLDDPSTTNLQASLHQSQTLKKVIFIHERFGTIFIEDDYSTFSPTSPYNLYYPKCRQLWPPQDAWESTSQIAKQTGVEVEYAESYARIHWSENSQHVNLLIDEVGRGYRYVNI